MPDRINFIVCKGREGGGEGSSYQSYHHRVGVDKKREGREGDRDEVDKGCEFD